MTRPIHLAVYGVPAPLDPSVSLSEPRKRLSGPPVPEGGS